LKLTVYISNAVRYYWGMIVGFRDPGTEALWATGRNRRLPPTIWRTAWRKLAILNAAVELNNLRVPLGNQFEALTKDRKGQHSIRVNDQYRICFRWLNGNAHDVEIVDYH